jgi:hypothetical protein
MASNTIGNTITKSKESLDKLNNVTQKISKVSTFVTVGAAIGGSDGLTPIRTIIENGVDGPLFDITQDLKQQAKGKAIQKVKEELPTRSELQESILTKSCDSRVMNIVTKTKNITLSSLNKGKNTLEGIIKKLERLKTKTDKILESLVQISALLAIFQALLTALKVIIVAAKLALVALVGLFASGKATEIIIDKIKKAEGLILIYVGAIKTYISYALKTVVKVIAIFNIIPLIIALFNTLLSSVNSFISLVERFYKEYIIRCTPINNILNSDGSLNTELINNYLNTQVNESENLQYDILGNYIYDDPDGDNDEGRIYRPKIN